MNKFLNFVEDANINNTQTYADFQSDSQRSQGFQSGNPASSIRVNTALRQANLVACALMDVCAPDDNTVDFRSTRASVAALINTKFASLGRTITLNGTIDNAPTFYAPTNPSTVSANYNKFLMTKGPNQAPVFGRVTYSDVEDAPPSWKRIAGNMSGSPGIRTYTCRDKISTVFSGLGGGNVAINFEIKIDNETVQYCRAEGRYINKNGIIYIAFSPVSALDAELDKYVVYEARATAPTANDNKDIDLTLRKIVISSGSVVITDETSHFEGITLEEYA